MFFGYTIDMGHMVIIGCLCIVNKKPGGFKEMLLQIFRALKLVNTCIVHHTNSQLYCFNFITKLWSRKSALEHSA